MFNLTFTSFT